MGSRTYWRRKEVIERNSYTLDITECVHLLVDGTVGIKRHSRYKNGIKYDLRYWSE